MTQKTFLILAANIFLMAAAALLTPAQDNKRIRPIPVSPAQAKKIKHKPVKVEMNREVVIEGKVSQGNQVSYDFTTEDEANISINLTGKNADFQIGVIDLEEPMRVTKWIKSFNGKLYPSDDGHYSIIVRSNNKSASFSLSILIK